MGNQRFAGLVSCLAFLPIYGAYAQSCTIDGDFMKIFEHMDPEDSTIIANIPPPLREGETLEGRQRVDQLLAQYWELGSGYYSRSKNQGSEYTYGEMSPLGVRQLARHMELHGNAVVFDVGSGVGKLVVQLYLESMALKVIGIENCPIRHGIATNVWDAISQTLPIHPTNSSRSVEFRNIDAKAADYAPATHVFLCSLCFPKELTDAVIQSLLHTAVRLQVVAALSDLPSLDTLSSWKKTLHNVQTTWGQSTLRVYVLQP